MSLVSFIRNLGIVGAAYYTWPILFVSYSIEHNQNHVIVVSFQSPWLVSGFQKSWCNHPDYPPPPSPDWTIPGHNLEYTLGLIW